MAKVVLYIAMSLDGYIADEGGGVSWLSGDDSDTHNPGSYPEFIETVDTVILGYKTYNQIVTELSPDNWIYMGKQSYVITHRKEVSTKEIEFTNEKLDDLITRLKDAEGGDIWICGGSTIVNQLIDLNMIDRFCITIIPTILGSGVPLFTGHKDELLLKLISTRLYNGMIDLVYEKREDKS